MKSTAWLRVVVVFLVLIGLATALLQWALSSPDDWKGLALNLATEMIGAAMTYGLLELFIGRWARREEAKRNLIAQMGSRVKDVAVAAAEELARRGWLYDGSLQGADLSWANLEGAQLHGANLQGVRLEAANLEGVRLAAANLQGAVLQFAKLQGAWLNEANLQDATLIHANLEGADLAGANLQGAYMVAAKVQRASFHSAVRSLDGTTTRKYTILPDGTKWTSDTDMTRFTDPTRPDLWHPDRYK